MNALTSMRRAIILSGLTLVLFLWSDLHEVLKALPGVLTAIATGLAGVFQWRESYECFACVVEALKSERLKFETRTTAEYSLELDEHQALSNFVARMEALVMAEVTDWRVKMQNAAGPRALAEQEE